MSYYKPKYGATMSLMLLAGDRKMFHLTISLRNAQHGDAVMS